jgi:tetratricopeptide (TPR) repeat protein
MHDRNHAAYVKGDKLYKLGKFADAAAQFKIALEAWSDDWQALWALGNCFTALKKPRKAEVQFITAIELAPAEKLPDLHFNLGNALFDQGKYANAILFYRQVPKGHHIACAAARNVALAERRINGVS